MAYFNRISMPDKGAWDENTLYHLFDMVSDPADSTSKFMLKVLETAGIHFRDLNYWEPVPNFADTMVAYQKNGSDAEVNALIAKLKEAGIMTSTKPTLTVDSLSEDMEVTPESVDPTISCVISSDDGREVALQWYTATDAEGAGESAISGETDAEYVLPTYTEDGVHYYFVKGTLEDVVKASDVIVVIATGFEGGGGAT